MKTINIIEDFTNIPGARHIEDGPFSGEAFRETCLEPCFANPADNEEIVIVLDGLEGYPVSFLDEAFGGLARRHGSERVLRRLRFVSKENPLLIETITGYIKDPDWKTR